jgi:hypothetical protein
MDGAQADATANAAVLARIRRAVVYDSPVVGSRVAGRTQTLVGDDAVQAIAAVHGLASCSVKAGPACTRVTLVLFESIRLGSSMVGSSNC